MCASCHERGGVWHGMRMEGRGTKCTQSSKRVGRQQAKGAESGRGRAQRERKHKQGAMQESMQHQGRAGQQPWQKAWTERVQEAGRPELHASRPRASSQGIACSPGSLPPRWPLYSLTHRPQHHSSSEYSTVG